MVATRNACHKVVQNKVSVVDCDRLDWDFTKDELFVALSSMNNGKSPGLDAISCEFHKVMKDIIGDDFNNMASKIFSTWCLSKFINQVLIKLIPKNLLRDTIGTDV